MHNFVLLTTGLLMSGSLFANTGQPAAMQQDMQQSGAAMQGSSNVTMPPPPAAFCKAYPDEKVCQQQPAEAQQPAAMPAKSGY
jgi:hypothetical protein